MTNDEVIKMHLLSERSVVVTDPRNSMPIVPDIEYPNPVSFKREGYTFYKTDWEYLNDEDFIYLMMDDSEFEQIEI